MSLNDFFDKIYCINLDRRPDRWEASQREFDRIGIEVLGYKATDGLTQKYEGPLLPGEYGILMSNVSLITDLWYFEKKTNKVLILEDDIEFSETFNRDWDQWSSEIPSDWDMLYLGGNLVGWNPSPVTEHVHNGVGVFAIHALGLSRRAMGALITHPNIWNQPIDVTYSQISAHLNSYIMVPRMAFQRTDYSDIQNAPADYQFLKQGQFPEVMGR